MVNTQLKIYFFGDSIFFGQYVSPHLTCVGKVSERISGFASQLGMDLVIQNPSINGNTTRQALERIPFDVTLHHPEILVVQFGINDCNHWETDNGVPRVSPAAFSANLEEIVRRAQANGTRRVLLNTNHPTGLDQKPLKGISQTHAECNHEYNHIIRSLAGGLSGVDLIDIESVFLAATSGDRDKLMRYLLPDGVHLSPAGHDLYAETICPFLESAIASLAG